MNTEPIKFLLVDDIEENLVALEALLRRDDLEILKARSGAGALELLLVHEVALAFVDVQMPEMDGFELAELMRGTERTKHVPIIFITAGARDPQRVFKGYESGAVDFLFKPIDPHVLKSKADVFFDLSRQRRDLANALRLNEMFVAILGHDLRNPLGTMLTGAELLKQQLADERQLRTLERMTSAGKRMTDMIEQLLDLTRARLAGGLGFARARKPVEVASLVQRTVEELQGAHPERNIVVEAQGESVTWGDADRLLQLFSNLVANAIQHGDRARPVSVSVAGRDGEIVVEVRNEGVIAPELLPTLFDPFRGRQGSGARSRGLGLGLFISQQIALAHGGRVRVQSNAEAGTLFSVHLPAKPATYQALARAAARVLIVEDDENVRDSLRTALEDAGYVALTATNGRDALAVLESGEARPDAVILELVSPVAESLLLHRAMRESPALSSIPVVVSTSKLGRGAARVAVLPRPLTIERLLRTVGELCRRVHAPS